MQKLYAVHYEIAFIFILVRKTLRLRRAGFRSPKIGKDSLQKVNFLPSVFSYFVLLFAALRAFPNILTLLAALHVFDFRNVYKVEFFVFICVFEASCQCISCIHGCDTINACLDSISTN